MCDDCGCAKQATPGPRSPLGGTNLHYNSRMMQGGEAVNALQSNGFNWNSQSRPYMSDIGNGQVAVVSGDGKTHLFERNGNSFTPLLGSQLELTLDSNTCELRMTYRNGRTLLFSDKGESRGVERPGQSQIHTTYNLSGQLEEMYEQFMVGGNPVRNSNLYEYIDEGPNAGLMQSVTVRREASPITEIRRMIYTYYEENEDFGNEGDLKTAAEQLLDGTTWVDHETYYYRYYKNGDPNGFEHGIKFVLKPQAFVRLSEDPQVSSPLEASDQKVAEYADNYYEYDQDHRATKSVTQGGLLTYTYSYDERDSHEEEENVNHWHEKVTATYPDGSQKITYTNWMHGVLLTDFSSSGQHWIDYHQYDEDNNREIRHAHPSAVIGYDDEEADLDVQLRTNAGLLSLTEYYDETEATSTEPGGVKNYVKRRLIQEGTAGDLVPQSERTYFARSANQATIYPVAESTVFRHDDGTGEIATTYDYTWYTNTLQIAQKTTTLPVVPISQNGTGSEDTITEVYDDQGHVIWRRDARGFISHFKYYLPLGVVIQEILDVDGTQLTLPNGWSTPPEGGLHLITDYEYDEMGRMTQSLGPEHDVNGQTVRTASWMVYRDLQDETFSAQGYATGLPESYDYTLINPVQIRHTASNGLSTDSISAVRDYDPENDTVESPGRLAESDEFPQASWVRWSRSLSNRHEQQISQRVYHEIPASGDGTVGTNYDETAYGYDLMNRRNRTVSASGTITRQVFDVRSQIVSRWIGTDDNEATDDDPTGDGATGNNMVQVSASQYDGGNDGGDGYLTQSTSYVDSSTTRVTQFDYDFRGRRTVVDGEIDFYQETAYDNLSHAIQVDRRDTTSTGNLIGRSETKYDDRGRVFQTIRYAVDPNTGSVGNSLVGNTFYDAAGNVIESRPSGSEAFTKATFDGVDRQIARYDGYTDATSSSSSSAFTGSVVAGDIVFEQSETTCDNAGNVTFTISRQRFHNATGTGPLQGPNGSEPKSRDSYVAMWYDGIGRSVAAADYGTNDNVGSPMRPDTPPVSSETILVNQTLYNERGDAFETVDPAGMVNRTISNDAGRTARTIKNYNAQDPTPGTDENVTTEMEYGPGGHLVKLIAINQSTGNQETEYEYGVTLADSELASNDLLRAEFYPDSDGPNDSVRYSYNRQSQQTEKIDQNGSVHQYDYDLLGRPTDDRVTTLGDGVDDAIRRISTSYDVRGLEEKITSHDAATGGNVANEVQNAYNDFGQLVEQYQEHDGAVNTSTTPKVQYGYVDGTGNTTRQTSTTYPNGRVLQHLYDDSAADKLSRIRTLHWDGTDVCRYDYLGLNTFVTTDYLEPEIKLDYALGSGSNPYTGFDRFGRIVDLLWEECGTSTSSSSSSSGGPGNAVVHLKYGYDLASNRTYREDLVAKSYGNHFDEMYEYDGVHRLKDFHRGELTNNNQTITNLTLQQGWELDCTGNWDNFTQEDTADPNQDLDQQRAQNRVNEITNIARTVGANWATPEYDKNGNMSVIPQPKEMESTYQATWDAWNRLVKLEDGANIIAEYAYNGLTWRTIVKEYDSGVFDETQHSYFSLQWQELEVRVNVLGIVEKQHVWGNRYIDDLIMRDRDTTKDGILEERLYSVQDVNWNVVTTFDSQKNIEERIAYKPYGDPQFLTNAYSVKSGSSYAWNQLFTGRCRDNSTGFYYFRHRMYDASLGTFCSRDPVKFPFINLYCYVKCNPLNATDPEGKEDMCTDKPPKAKEWSESDCPRTCKDHYKDGLDQTMLETLARKLKAGGGRVGNVFFNPDCGGTDFSLTCRCNESKIPNRPKIVKVVCINTAAFSDTCSAIQALEHEFAHVHGADEEDAYRKSCRVQAKQECWSSAMSREEVNKKVEECVNTNLPKSSGASNIDTINQGCVKLCEEYNAAK